MDLKWLLKTLDNENLMRRWSKYCHASSLPPPGRPGEGVWMDTPGHEPFCRVQTRGPYGSPVESIQWSPETVSFRVQNHFCFFHRYHARPSIDSYMPDQAWYLWTVGCIARLAQNRTESLSLQDTFRLTLCYENLHLIHYIMVDIRKQCEETSKERNSFTNMYHNLTSLSVNHPIRLK